MGEGIKDVLNQRVEGEEGQVRAGIEKKRPPTQ